MDIFSTDDGRKKKLDRPKKKHAKMGVKRGVLKQVVYANPKLKNSLLQY